MKVIPETHREHRLLVLLLGRYLCWWTISCRGYNLQSSQLFSNIMV